MHVAPPMLYAARGRLLGKGFFSIAADGQALPFVMPVLMRSSVNSACNRVVSLAEGGFALGICGRVSLPVCGASHTDFYLLPRRSSSRARFDPDQGRRKWSPLG
jgi:hypothetical protein